MKPPVCAALRCCLLVVAFVVSSAGHAGPVRTAGGEPAELDIRTAGNSSLRVTLKPLDYGADLSDASGVVGQDPPRHRFSLREIDGIVIRRMGRLYVTVTNDPLSVDVSTRDGRSVQNIVFTAEGSVSFRLDDRPVLGLGQGGPPMGDNWREEPLAFDRRGRLYEMAPSRQRKAYGTRNPVPLLIGTSGWALYVVAPWVQVDLQDERRGLFLPRESPAGDVAAQSGRPPRDSIVKGLFDFFLFDAGAPEHFMEDLARVSGKALLPPRWALGYMQAHGTLEGEEQMLGIVETFRDKRIPLDAVLYRGSNDPPRGWNAGPESSAFNTEVFSRSPEEVIRDLHRQNVKVILQTAPPADEGAGEAADAQGADEEAAGGNPERPPPHLPLLEAGVDALWVGGSDGLDLHAHMERQRRYYEEALAVQPDERPWSLHSNGHLGIARWGGWLRSGNTDSAWRTLEAQITVGINHALSVSPWWGSDVGGDFPGEELTAELYMRWFQFGAFTPLFLSNGKTWWTRLPWGWGLSEMGPLEHEENPLPSELGNPAIEDIARLYVELRYRLLPYNYTLAWQARETGMPPMRALWLHYPDDTRAAGVGSEYLWGRDLLVAPVFRQGAKARELYLPPGIWYDWWTDERLAGRRTVTRAVDLATMPIYARAGAIIPLDPVRQYAGERAYSPTTLKVFRGDNGEFFLYDDDGASRDYLHGESTLTRIVWDDAESMLTMEPAAGSDRSPASRRFLIELIPGGQTRRLTYLGRRVTIDFSN